MVECLGNDPLTIVTLGLVIATIILAVANFWLVHLNRRQINMLTFEKALDLFASETVRIARGKVHEHFPDYTDADYPSEKWRIILSFEKIEPYRFTIKEGLKGYQEKEEIIRILYNNIYDEKILEYKKEFEDVAVAADRVGFMFFELKISDELKRNYLKWLCVTYCGLWNKIAPHIEQVRVKRIKYVPYFEKLVYASYYYYNEAIENYNKNSKEAKKEAKLIVLNKKLLEDELNKSL